MALRPEGENSNEISAAFVTSFVTMG